MFKYIRKSEEVEAQIYKEGMEHDWIVYYTGNFFDYVKILKTKQECINFINDDKGKEECDYEDARHKIIYENPVPRIAGQDIREGDYIIRHKDGRVSVKNPKEFNGQYMLIK